MAQIAEYDYSGQVKVFRLHQEQPTFDEPQALFVWAQSMQIYLSDIIIWDGKHLPLDLDDQNKYKYVIVQ